ncbi:MAG: hypothetical protein IIX89_03455 [Oscillospiraceae bacterium]|nr:hypothetical protein [Oscillospiraceae bacterium]
MVKKLFKYEFASYLKVLVPFNIVMLSVALFTRLIQFFDMDIPVYSTIYDIVFGLSTMTYFLSTAACFAAVLILAVIRFHKNLYSAEGYLSFTLPVTATQHIFVKLGTALALSAITLVSIVVSFAVFSAGDLGIEVVKAADYLLKLLFDKIGINLWFYAFELIVLLIVSLSTSLLFYYTCISLGQLFKKNRILGAVGVYFIFYVATQIISGIVMFSYTIVVSTIDMVKVGEFIAKHYIPLLHTAFGVGILIYAAVGTAHFFVNRYIMVKKLNLE